LLGVLVIAGREAVLHLSQGAVNSAPADYLRTDMV